MLRQIDLGINSNKIRYRYARNALFRLWGHGDWEKKLQILKDGDVRGLNERALNAEELAQEELLRERGLLNELQGAGFASPGLLWWLGTQENVLCHGSGMTCQLTQRTLNFKMVCDILGNYKNNCSDTTVASITC